MGKGNSFPAQLVNRSRTHRVWAIVSVKVHESDVDDMLFRVVLEPGTMSPEGVDVDFVGPHDGGPEIRHDGRLPGPGAWWKLGAGGFSPKATIDDGPNNTLLLSTSWVRVAVQSGAELEKWGVKKNSWPGVSDGRQAVRVPQSTPPPPPPPPVTTAPLPGPPSGSRPGAGAPPPPPQNATPAPSPARPPGPPPQGLPPAAWLTGVQARLKYLSFYNGPIHDKFDTPTRDAVLSFQSRHGLKVDGIPGPKTQARLAEVVGA